MPRTPPCGGGTSNITTSAACSASTASRSPSCAASAHFSISLRICSSSAGMAMCASSESCAHNDRRNATDSSVGDGALLRHEGHLAGVDAGAMGPRGSLEAERAHDLLVLMLEGALDRLDDVRVSGPVRVADLAGVAAALENVVFHVHDLVEVI